MLRKIKSAVAKWWEGDVTVYDPPIIGIHIERHWSAQTISWCINFLKKEWKWVLGFLVALAGVYFRSVGKL